MTPLLKSLLGNGSKDRETAEEMRALLNDMQKERSRYEALVRNVETAADRLGQLGEPIAKAGSDVDLVVARLAELEQRFSGVAQLSNQLQTLEERAGGLTESQRRAEEEIANAAGEVQRVRSTFEEIEQKVDVALDLRDRLGAFLDVDKPFQQLRDDAGVLRGQVDGTGEQMARLREQHDRLLDALKLAMQKMEALDRRRDDMGRSLTDKERRVAGVEQAVRGMDGVQHTVEDVRRDIGALKALGDTVVQKAAALEAQREAVTNALAQADHLDRAMRQMDAGVRQQQDNEKALNAMQDQVATLRSLHEAVLERSSSISQLQRETDEHTEATRQDLNAMTGEMKKTVERFDFESRGLESVSQRVADVRGALSDCESRFKALNGPSLAVGELGARTQGLAAQLQVLGDEVGNVDREMVQFRAIRRDLDETGRTVRGVAAQVSQIEETRPALEAGLRDLERLAGAHATAKDALEQTQLAQDEMTRMRESQSETRTWMADLERSVGEIRERADQLLKMGPSIEVAQKHAQRLGDSMAAIESRRESVEDLNRRLMALGSTGGKLDERSKQMQAQMETVEQRFAGLADRMEEADRLSVTVAAVSSDLGDAERKTGEIVKAVAAIAARCDSVEALAEHTRALKPELEQRHGALAEAAKDLQKATALRKSAATSAQQLEDLVQRLTAALTAADERVARMEETTTQLENRTANLKSVEKRLGQFEERLAKWTPVEKEIALSLDQITARLGTVETLREDLDRMFTTAEKTATEVREITSAQQEIEQSRQLLGEVLERLQEARDVASSLDERKRQMVKAEERLARAEAVLTDVQSSLEALQGQKALVDQAVEKSGSLQFLLKQAEATIDGLREERELTSRVRAAVAAVRNDEDDDEIEAKAA